MFDISKNLFKYSQWDYVENFIELLENDTKRVVRVAEQ